VKPSPAPTTAVGRRAAARELRAEFEAALLADWMTQPYQAFGCCSDCAAVRHCKGPRPTRRRCFLCHSHDRAARSRARRRTTRARA
jgi:hypothetical protein